jgi:CO/xanthine dehydrogenase FAD-binding subunit
MMDFEYEAPGSLDEALSLLEKSPGARILAGGTDLVVQMKYGRVHPAVIVDVKKIPDLNRLEWTDDRGLFIGAAVPVSRIISFPPIESKYGVLHSACSLIGSFQLRSRATVGGNICNAAPSADSVPPLLCLEARAVIAGPAGRRDITLRDFFVGPGKTVLTSTELLVGIEIPPPLASSSGCYLRHIPRQDMDIAVVGVASYLVFGPEVGRCREARIALGAVAPTPMRAAGAESLLRGKNIARETIEEAANLAAEAALPISDMRGSANYRSELVRVLTRRTLEKAMDAGGVSPGKRVR